MKKHREISWILFYRSCPGTIFCNGFSQEIFVFSIVDPTKPFREDTMHDLKRHVFVRGVAEPVVRAVMDMVGIRV